MAALFVVLAAVTSGLIAYHLYQHLSHGYQCWAEAIALRLARAPNLLPEAHDPAGPKTLLKEAGDIQGLAYVIVQDAHGAILCQSINPKIAGSRTELLSAATALPEMGAQSPKVHQLPGFIDVCAPITNGQGGMVRVGMDKKQIQSAMLEAVGEQLLVLTALFLACAALACFVALGVSRPLRRLSGLVRSTDTNQRRPEMDPQDNSGDFGFKGRSLTQTVELIARQVTELSQAKLRLEKEAARREEAGQALAQSKQATVELLDCISDGFVSMDQGLKVTFFNQAAERMLNRQRSEIQGRNFFEAFPEAKGTVLAEIADQALRQGQPLAREIYFPAPPYANWYEVRVFPRKEEILVFFRVTTKRKEAEEKQRRIESNLQQAQKLESLGLLAGGIAHDFNNLLMGVMGNAGLALYSLSPEAPARTYVEAIETTAQRLAELTNELLAYSGRGRFQARPLNVSHLVTEIGELLKTVVSKKAMVNLQLEDGLPAVEADPTQVRQVVMNLITNASDALEDNDGVITVRTGARQVDRSYLADTFLDEDLGEGLYVFVEVSDTGCGMDPETREKIFEPFFTTKVAGRGLGLAAVLGIVRGHQGAIKVYSEPGSGTCIKVLLPSTDLPAQEAEKEISGDLTLELGKTILVVDDEPVIREICGSILEKAGCRVLTAEDGVQAVEVFDRHRDEVDLVLLDMTMPRMGGDEAFRRMRVLKPGIKVILTSGYNEQEATTHFVGKGLAGFLQKPYRPVQLIEKIRRTLAESQARQDPSDL
jgi:signal transduction histidine kinase/ActR/RegA family two-component response regulator